jgi:Protein of Unknown function (DUF2784)
MYRFLADFVVTTHLAYILFVLFGTLAILLGGWLKWAWIRNRWFRRIHLAAIALVAVQAIFGWTCPLTTWEKSLRCAAGQLSHDRSFIGYWAHQLVFVDLDESVLTICYCLLAAATLLLYWGIPPQSSGYTIDSDKK